MKYPEVFAIVQERRRHRIRWAILYILIIGILIRIAISIMIRIASVVASGRWVVP